MKVRCINNAQVGMVTFDKEYDVIAEDPLYYRIKRDDGEFDWFQKYRFEVVEEEKLIDKVVTYNIASNSNSISEQCQLELTNPLNVQIAGDHYKSMKIQPVEYAHANKLDFFQGSVVKYITRFRDKNGKQDLEKAKHFIDLLIKLEYGKENN